eukprot:scaffold415_cov362-Prasinococcus_capsulatus_cf.AAC.23
MPYATQPLARWHGIPCESHHRPRLGWPPGGPRIHRNLYGGDRCSTRPRVFGPSHNDADNSSSQQRTASSSRASNGAHACRAFRLTGLWIARLACGRLGRRAGAVINSRAIG